MAEDTACKLTHQERLYLDQLRSHLNNTRDRTEYAEKRMDILIISLSGAGIIIVLEIIKHIKTPTNLLSVDAYWIKFAGLEFVLAIISNFISQWTGLYANSNEEQWIELEIERIENDYTLSNYPRIYKDLAVFDKRVKRYNFLTDLFNFFATFMLVTGILILMLYSITTF